MGYAPANLRQNSQEEVPHAAGSNRQHKSGLSEIKTFCIDSWEGEYRSTARVALKEIVESRRRHWVDRSLQGLQARDVVDRRNGYFCRHLLTELGDLELSIPRTRTFSAIGIMRQVAGDLGRRAGHVERMILLAFT